MLVPRLSKLRPELDLLLSPWHMLLPGNKIEKDSLSRVEKHALGVIAKVKYYT